jgi:asparagine synthase (glutamine-hydrolysing)
MCGIAGFIDSNTPAEARERAVLAMCDSMIHRGPDDSGRVTHGRATLGMRRLAIFDPVRGHQPMTTPDGRFSVVFNGAIYNFRALQDELESAGWVFHTRCDTEVLLAALAHWGEGALDRLRGMYAFALWDRSDESLLVARDPFGIKPLYYSQEGGRLVFASEVSALIASGAVPSEIDPAAVADYLGWLAVPAPRTIYRHIRNLEPGACLRYREGTLTLKSTWSLRSLKAGEPPCATREDFIRELRARLEDSIRAHVLADVPVGAFLSGGLDSAVVAGLMSRATGNALRTFSIGFEETSFSEANEAEASARHFGAVHHTRILTGDEVARDLDRILAACDQPTGDGVNTYYASQSAVAGGVRAALSGLGGDELFGGYPSFKVVPRMARVLPLWARVPSGIRRAASGALSRQGVRGMKLADFLEHAKDAHEVASLQRRVFSERGRRSLLSPEVWDLVKGAPPFHPMLDTLRRDVGGGESSLIVSNWEVRTYMADVLLRDSDVMSMRHSLELRVPFIDRPLIEWLWRQPAAFFDDPRRPKSALVEATADLLPPGLLGRKKWGFTLPFPIWMRRDLRPFLEEAFSEESVRRSSFFAPGPVRALWQEFVSGGEDRQWSRLWSLAVLIAFLNRRPATGAPA